MGSNLQEEIKQKASFSSIEQEALLSIHWTAGLLAYRAQNILKKRGLTLSQYNVLRILRGAGRDGLRCSEIGERLIHRDPDITRILGRLQKQGMIEQRRDPADRRAIYSRISATGLRILRRMDPLVDRTTRASLAHLAPERLLLLIRLLEEVRAAETDDEI